MRSVMLSMLVWTACGGALIGQDGKADPKKLQADLQAAISAQNWDKAVTVGRELTALQPENGSAWFQLGYALHAQGKLDDAIVAHKKAAEFKPTRTVGL
ncbi:MAG TPA: tetratricopeptide repeat protein, partial [Planctomycetota bacterium]|nr:tetratricopeptide repeat protein [Planctomycetota bacterium]